MKKPQPKFPEHLPVLEPKHMHANALHKLGDTNCQCLMGWVLRTCSDRAARDHLYKALSAAAKRLFPDRFARHKYPLHVPNINDHTLKTPEERALVWNTAIRDLGFTEVVDA